MSAQQSDMKLDGNAIGGLLREIFAMEMTMAQGTCANCGKVHMGRGCRLPPCARRRRAMPVVRLRADEDRARPRQVLDRHVGGALPGVVRLDPSAKSLNRFQASFEVGAGTCLL